MAIDCATRLGLEQYARDKIRPLSVDRAGGGI
jgi:hypothetical protein